MTYPWGAPASPPPQRAHPGVVWGVAAASGVLVYAGLLAVHLSRETSGSTAFRAGEMMPPALLTTVVVGLLAQFAAPAGARARWLVPSAVPVAIASLAFGWYAFIHLLPEMVNDAQAEASGQADYRLRTPATAGDWKREDGRGVSARRKQALEEFADYPGMQDNAEVLYAEYVGHHGTTMVFIGMNATGELEDDLRDSTRRTLEDMMSGAGATGVRDVDEGDLGGSMRCGNGLKAAPVDLVYCAWADASTAGQVFIVDPHLEVATGAEWARDFREHVTEE